MVDCVTLFIEKGNKLLSQQNAIQEKLNELEIEMFRSL